MPTRKNLWSTRTLAAVAGTVGSLVLATPLAMGSSPEPEFSGDKQAAQKLAANSLMAGVQRAGELAESGRYLEARRELSATLDGASFSALTLAQRGEVHRLMREIDRKIDRMDPVELSLARASLALDEGDLIGAERHALRVLDREGVPADQVNEANEVLEAVRERRRQMLAVLPQAMDAAGAALEAGDIEQARAWVSMVVRSGVELSPSRRELLETYQYAVISADRGSSSAVAASASAFTGDVETMGMFQPGVVRRRGGEPADQPPPTPEPIPEPQTEPMDIPDEPAPEVEPEPEPAPAPAIPIAEPTRVEPQPAPRAVSVEQLLDEVRRAEAQRVLAEANAAYEAARYADAAERYAFVLDASRNFLTPDQVTQAQERLAASRTRLRGVGTDLGQDVLQGTRLLRERAEAQFENQLAASQRALNAGDPAEARRLAASAELTITQARRAFNESEVDAFVARVRSVENRIEARAEQLRISDAEREARTQAQRTLQAERSQREERDRKIVEALERARALQQELKYEEALDVIDQVLFLDPNNPSALLLRDVFRDISVNRRYNDMLRDRANRFTQMELDNFQAALPPLGIMEFPSDWPRKSLARGEESAYAEPIENRRVLAKLENDRVPVQFDDNTLSDVLNFIATVSGLDMDIDWQSLREIGVDRDSLVTLNLRNPPLRVVLERVLDRASADPFDAAGWAVYDGVLTIASERQLRKNRTLVIYDITDLILDIPNFPDAPVIDLDSVLQQSQGGGGGGGQSPFQENEQDAEERPTRQERIDRIVEIIQAIVDTDGWRDNGGETGEIQELNASLIITNTPKNHREIVGLLSKLREVRSIQINIETKFLLVSQEWFEQIGFDIDVVFNANNNQVRAARAVDPSIQAGDFFDFTQPGGLRRQITGQRGVGPDGGTPAISQPVVNPRSWSPVGVGSNSLGLAGGLAADDSFANQILGNAPALGIAGQFLDDIQVDFLIQATQADRRTTQLTAPRLTITNGQTSNIFVVTQQAFISDLEPVVGDSAVGFDPEVATVSEGVVMLVEGVVSADRRYVQMNIDSSLGRIDGFAREPVVAIAGGQLVNSEAAQQFIQLPTVTVTRVRTTATVPDEGTLLLGGQRLITELEVETGVPVLSKVPIISRFFTNRIESKTEQTLLILVKPTVLIQSEQEERAYPGLGDSLRSSLGIPGL